MEATSRAEVLCARYVHLLFWHFHIFKNICASKCDVLTSQRQRIYEKNFIFVYSIIFWDLRQQRRKAKELKFKHITQICAAIGVICVVHLLDQLVDTFVVVTQRWPQFQMPIQSNQLLAS